MFARKIIKKVKKKSYTNRKKSYTNKNYSDIVKEKAVHRVKMVQS